MPAATPLLFLWLLDDRRWLVEIGAVNLVTSADRIYESCAGVYM